MTYVGKILVMVIMAFALLFLGVSTVVFTTATNWKSETDKVKQKVTELTTKNNDANAQVEALKKDLETATKSAAEAKKGLENRIAALQTEIDQLNRDHTAARAEVATAQENARTALVEAEHRRNETNTLREQKLAVEKQADEYKLRQAELNDQIRLLTRERDVAKKNNEDLRDRAARFSQLLRQNGLSDDISLVKGLASPPTVHGEVSRVDQNKVEITIGSDDGLVVGHVLDIYRLKPRSEYIGKIRIIAVDPDQAVGVVVGKTVQGKKIMEGDNVSSSFRSTPRS